MCEDVDCSYRIPHLPLRHRTKCLAKSRMAEQMLRWVGKCPMSGRYFAHCTRTHTNGQMLSPPNVSTSTLRSVAEIAPPVSRDRAYMRYVESWRQCYNPPGAWPESSRGTKNGAALRLDTKAHTYPSAA